ncbi:MAG: hypothetical protein ACRBFS_27080 [Aureispira sp.]
MKEGFEKDLLEDLYWCMSWTLDQAKYERYTANIKARQADFIFENEKWKINEK